VLEPYKIVRVYTTSLHTYGINYFHHSPINIEANFILCLARNSANRESFSMAFPHKCCLIKYFSKTIINNSEKVEVRNYYLDAGIQYLKYAFKLSEIQFFFIKCTKHISFF